MNDRSFIERLPDDLTDRDQWVCWRTETRDGTPTKVPIDPSTGRFASTTDPSTWGSFDRAHEYARKTDAVDGLGFVFTEDDPLVGIDLDGCRDPETGRPTERAKDIVDRLDSYTEVSPSGTGYHVIVRGSLPSGRNRHDDVECYATSRYFTMTGDHVPGTPETVEERSEALSAVHEEYVATTAPEAESDPRRPAIALGDRELLQRAMGAANGERFERLWNGSTAGYPSQSEADMALCCHLTFWTGGDTDRMDRLFRESGLMREKWDEVHFADGSTYGEKTISRAIEQVTEYYDPTGTSTKSDAVSATMRSQNPSGGRSEEPVDRSAHLDDERSRAIIERLDRRIKALEAENERLRSQLEDSSTGDEPSVESPRSSERESLWSRAKRIFGIV